MLSFLLILGAKVLVEEYGCTAIAVVVRFPEDTTDEEGENWHDRDIFIQFTTRIGTNSYYILLK